MTMLAYEQVQAKRKQQAETSNAVLKMQFKAALEGKGGVDLVVQKEARL